VEGHTIQAIDGSVGHVVDFVIDDESWSIRYLIIDTQNWWPGKKLLISVEWIDQITWEDSQVVVALTRDAIQASPEYTPEGLITRDYEEHLHKHYGRPHYWSRNLESVGASRR
jgi:hypothetical protein